MFLFLVIVPPFIWPLNVKLILIKAPNHNSALPFSRFSIDPPSISHSKIRLVNFMIVFLDDIKRYLVVSEAEILRQLFVGIFAQLIN